MAVGGKFEEFGWGTGIKTYSLEANIVWSSLLAKSKFQGALSGMPTIRSLTPTTFGNLQPLIGKQRARTFASHWFERYCASHGRIPSKPAGFEQELFLLRFARGNDLLLHLTRHLLVVAELLGVNATATG